MEAIYHALRPDKARLIGLRKRFVFTSSSPSHPEFERVTTYSVLTEGGDFALYLIENLFATELVAMLAISCAWLCHPQSELRLRAGLPPPPWMATWMMSFRILHWIGVNAFCFMHGTDTNFISFRIAVAMWGTAVIIVVLVVAAYIARAMLRNAWEEWKYRWTAGRTGKLSFLYSTPGPPILKGEDVLPNEERSKLKRE